MAQTNSYTPAKVNTFAGSGAPNNGTYGNSRDLLLKAFSGEMIKHFDEKFALKNGVRSIVRAIAEAICLLYSPRNSKCVSISSMLLIHTELMMVSSMVTSLALVSMD